MPESIRSAAKQRLPGLRERAYRQTEYTVIDWSRTQAFAYGTFGNIVINVRGREAQGIVEPGETYRRLCDEIASRARDLAGPDGERIVRAVYHRDELFDVWSTGDGPVGAALAVPASPSAADASAPAVMVVKTRFFMVVPFECAGGSDID